jgi:hypothetical protein
VLNTEALVMLQTTFIIVDDEIYLDGAERAPEDFFKTILQSYNICGFLEVIVALF